MVVAPRGTAAAREPASRRVSPFRRIEHRARDRRDARFRFGVALGYSRNTVVDRGASELPVDPVVEAYKRHIDRSLIRENLKLSVEARLERLVALQQFADELRRAGASVRGS